MYTYFVPNSIYIFWENNEWERAIRPPVNSPKSPEARMEPHTPADQVLFSRP